MMIWQGVVYQMLLDRDDVHRIDDLDMKIVMMMMMIAVVVAVVLMT